MIVHASANAANGHTHPRRVVVTGMGVVSPLGCDTDTFYDRLLAGRKKLLEDLVKMERNPLVQQISPASGNTSKIGAILQSLRPISDLETFSII